MSSLFTFLLHHYFSEEGLSTRKCSFVCVCVCVYFLWCLSVFSVHSDLTGTICFVLLQLNSKNVFKGIFTLYCDIVWICVKADQRAVHTRHKPAGQVGHLHWRNRQCVSTAQLSRGRAHPTSEDGAAETDGGCGWWGEQWRRLSAVCHQLSLGAGLGFLTALSEAHLHPSAWEVGNTVHAGYKDLALKKTC
jgi:hypothetical protein